MNEKIAPSASFPSAAPRPRAVFTGENGTFQRLVARGALLELVTFGFYRFWLATDIRQHLWTHTSIEGDAHVPPLLHRDRPWRSVAAAARATKS